MASCLSLSGFGVQYSVVSKRKLLFSSSCKEYSSSSRRSKDFGGPISFFNSVWQDENHRTKLPCNTRKRVIRKSSASKISMSTRFACSTTSSKDTILQISQDEAETLIREYCKIDQKEQIQIKTEVYPIDFGDEKSGPNVAAVEPQNDLVREPSAFLTLSGGTYWTIEDVNKSKDVALGRRCATKDDLTQMLVVAMIVSVPLSSNPGFLQPYESALKEPGAQQNNSSHNRVAERASPTTPVPPSDPQNKVVGERPASPSRLQKKTPVGSLTLDQWIAFRQGPLPGLAAHWGVATLQRQTQGGLGFVLRVPMARSHHSEARRSAMVSGFNASRNENNGASSPAFWAPGTASFLAPTRWISPPRGWRSLPDFSYHLGFNATQTPFNRPKFLEIVDKSSQENGNCVGDNVDGSNAKVVGAGNRWVALYPLLVQMRYEGAVRGADGGLALVLRIPALPGKSGAPPREVWVKGALPPLQIPLSHPPATGEAGQGRRFAELPPFEGSATSQWNIALDEKSAGDYLATLLPSLLSSGVMSSPSSISSSTSLGSACTPEESAAAATAARPDVVGVFRVKNQAANSPFPQNSRLLNGHAKGQTNGHTNSHIHGSFHHKTKHGGSKSKGDFEHASSQEDSRKKSANEVHGSNNNDDKDAVQGHVASLSSASAQSSSLRTALARLPPFPDKSSREPFEGVDFIFPTSALPDLIGGSKEQEFGLNVGSMSRAGSATAMNGLPRFVCWTPPPTSDRDACPTQPKTVSAHA